MVGFVSATEEGDLSLPKRRRPGPLALRRKKLDL
jgi:hypothetical protein